MMDDVKLKPCPFCGGEAHIVTGVEESFMKKYPTVKVVCNKCDNRTAELMDTSFNAYVVKIVTDRWNRRVNNDD